MDGTEADTETTQSDRADRLFKLSALITAVLFLIVVAFGLLEFSSRPNATPAPQQAHISEAGAERGLESTVRADRRATAAAIATEVALGSTETGIVRSSPCPDGLTPIAGTPCPGSAILTPTSSPRPSATAPNVGTPAQ